MTKLRRQPSPPLPPEAAKAFYPPLGVNLKATPSGRGRLLNMQIFIPVRALEAELKM